MEIIHNFRNMNLRKEIDANPTFFLKNRLGNYLMLSADPKTRYEGFFFHKDMDMFKSLSSIVPAKSGKLLRVINNMHEVKRIFEHNTERFFMPLKESAFVYELLNEDFIELFFDGKEIYDNREFGRHYDVIEEGDKIIIHFSMVNEELKKEDYGFYAAISDCSGKIPLYQKTGTWKKESYDYDKRRESWPWERSVCSAVKIRAKKLVIAVSMSKDSAVIENNFVAEHLGKLEAEVKERTLKLEMLDKSSMEANLAFINAQNSVLSLLTETDFAESRKFIMAGLPWFFHFWTRDTPIAVGALIAMEKYKHAKDILMVLVDEIHEDGKMFNRNASQDKAADSAGWTFMRLYQLFKVLHEKNELFSHFDAYELQYVADKLQATILALKEKHTEGNLIRNDAIETWVDTKIKADVRDGFRIEIQLLHLMMLKCLNFLGDMLGKSSLKDYAAEKEKFLKGQIRKKFWNGKMLLDGIGDETIRPNVFLAHYIYPELLSRDEWDRCFDASLNHLSINWEIGAGLASIDKESNFFYPKDLGEDSSAYHHGDAWFWIDNIAALALFEVNKEKYKSVINKLIASSTHDLLWDGAIGHSSEISSAEKYEPMGCWVQAWSASTFVELIKNIFGNV